jgi:hypothetical protein
MLFQDALSAHEAQSSGVAAERAALRADLERLLRERCTLDSLKRVVAAAVKTQQVRKLHWSALWCCCYRLLGCYLCWCAYSLTARCFFHTAAHVSRCDGRAQCHSRIPDDKSMLAHTSVCDVELLVPLCTALSLFGFTVLCCRGRRVLLLASHGMLRGCSQTSSHQRSVSNNRPRRCSSSNSSAGQGGHCEAPAGAYVY